MNVTQQSFYYDILQAKKDIFVFFEDVVFNQESLIIKIF
jgi:hypothetical protein